MIKKIVLILVFIFLCLSGFFGLIYLNSRIGFLRDTINISGTGSMYPTFPKGQSTDSARLSEETVASIGMRRYPGGLTLGNIRFFNHKLEYGDIISFENITTDKITQNKIGHAAGFVKRIIALSGDSVEIRDGFVWRNRAQLLENYTAKARSTFGGEFLPDCKTLVIPEGYAFVLGDNRKGSNDSRHELGLIALSDIDHYLPLSEQNKYAHAWRDSSQDISFSLKPVLDKKDYINLLNQKRRENKLPELTHQPKLDLSAAKRADVILNYDDMSFEATKSGYTMQKAMSDSGYSNIVWGEVPTLGYYDASELIENYFEFPNSTKFLLNPDFQETGLAVKVGQLHNCPVQIVVQHLAGYKPPNYKPEVITSWQQGLKSLETTLPSWENIKTYSQFYSDHKNEVDELLSLFNLRISRSKAIISRMQANEWLTSQEETWTKEEEKLSKRMSELSSKLNSY